MPHRRIALIVLAVLSLICLPKAAMAQSTAPAGYADHSAKPLGIDTKVTAAQLVWLNQVFGLMGSSDFTFIYRIDPDHWMGLFREHLAMILHIHDGPAGFDFRALVDHSTGRLTVIKGVAFTGQDQLASARTSANLALGYLKRVLDNRDIFSSVSTAGQRAEAEGMAATDGPASRHPVTGDARKPAGSEDPLSRLMDGNRRYVSGRMEHPDQEPARRAEVAKGQKPFAIVLTCSDSRLPPEILFDQGLGDLFVVRTAGEVVGDLEIGSIEYAAEHLHATHLMVLGHERCGAVDATIKGGEFSDAIARIAMQIQPAVAAAKGRTGELLDNAIRQNVLNVRDAVMRSPVLEDLAHEKKFSVSTAYYDLDSGMVSLIDAAELQSGASGAVAPAPAARH
jgi:carbonic anhydrase